MNWWNVWAWFNVVAGIVFGVAACNGHPTCIIATFVGCTMGGFIAGGEWMAKLWKIPRL